MVKRQEKSRCRLGSRKTMEDYGKKEKKEMKVIYKESDLKEKRKGI